MIQRKSIFNACPITLSLIGAFIVFSGFMLIQIISEISQGLEPSPFGFIPNEALQLRYLSRWVTSTFRHGGLSHIFSNSLPLLCFGSFLERELGPKKYLILFFGSAFGGDLLLVILKHQSTENHLGASGGVMGVVTYFILASRIKSDKNCQKSRWDFLSIVAALIFVLPNILGFWSEVRGDNLDQVSYLSHLGGALAGFLCFEEWKLEKEVQGVSRKLKAQPKGNKPIVYRRVA